MTQLNLLPDIKLEYLRAQRLRRLVTSVSVLVTIVAVVIMVLLLVLTMFQRRHLASLNHDIKVDSSSIEGQPDLNKVLTIQNQLASLPKLHDSEPAASRLFGYLSELTPSSANINNLSVDFTQNQITITGTANSLVVINQYIDTLKFTNYTVDGSNPTKAFSNVVLSSFSVSQHETDYTITMNCDQTIFENTQNVKLTVPNKVTTRSEIGQPTDLFQLPIDHPSVSATNAGSKG